MFQKLNIGLKWVNGKIYNNIHWFQRHYLKIKIINDEAEVDTKHYFIENINPI